jgi:hypothetical protein
VELTLVVGSNEIVVAGIVRTCHAIMGNGIEFTAVTDETRNSVEQLISRLATTPSLPDQPDYGRALSLEAKVEAILQLLERKKVMSEGCRCAAVKGRVATAARGTTKVTPQ